MPTSVRVAVVLTVLLVWTTVVIAYLVQHRLPDAILLGIPAAVILAAAPRPGRGGQDEVARRDTPNSAPSGPAPTETREAQ